MRPCDLPRQRLLLGSLALLALLVMVGAQTTAARTIALPVITSKGVGGVRLGQTAQHLRGANRIGPLRDGCELDPGQRIANLSKPLHGFVVFSHPRNRVASITIVAGTAQTSAGIGIGSRLSEARATYPTAQYTKPGETVFGSGFLWIHNERDPKITFTINPKTQIVSEVSVPAPAFCE